MSAADLEPCGWAYQDEVWMDDGRWHLCMTEPRAIKGRKVQRVFLADTLAAMAAENDHLKKHNDGIVVLFEKFHAEKVSAEAALSEMRAELERLKNANATGGGR
jgi:hypothetical protein